MPAFKEERILRCWMRFSPLFFRFFFRTLAIGFPVWGATLLLIVFLGIIFSFVENVRIYEALYCAFITAMTVGYGDITPVTRYGMALSVMMGVMGIITSGIIVALAVKAGSMAYDELEGGISEKKASERK